MLVLCSGTALEPAAANEVSSYLLTKPRILRDVCRATGRDDGGGRCPVCCVREFCASQAKRADDLLGDP
jgi:hypothetical protein